MLGPDGGTAWPHAMPGPDKIRMPLFTQFNSAAAAYRTEMHEQVHRTGHPSRLNRTFGLAAGDPDYAVEELVAEFGTLFICAELGLDLEMREDHIPYMGHWAERIKADYRVLFNAAAQGQRAADFLKDRQPKLLQAMKGQGAPAPV